MLKRRIKQLIETRLPEDGLIETGLKGVQLFRVSTSVPCVPAVYEPTIVAILSGTKEAITEGRRHIYDREHYLCCTVSMPVQAGTPLASADHPLLGVTLTLDPRLMAEVSFAMQNASGCTHSSSDAPQPPGLVLSRWDDAFADALLRLLELDPTSVDQAVLGEGRLRELYFAILNGDAGAAVMQAFGTGNEIAKVIERLISRLDQPVSIEEMAQQAGMSRAVLHRKFKHVTSMSPMQFVKSMRLNEAAKRIVEGTPINVAALDVGYVSTSQFNREFKRLYGHPPKQWALSEDNQRVVV